MFKKVLALVAVFGLVGFAGESYARPKIIRKTIEVVAPEEYNVSITLQDGSVIKTEKVALTQQSLQKRLVLNSLDKTVRVFDTTTKEVKVIETASIVKIEIERVPILTPKPEPTPTPVPTPQPKVKIGRNFITIN
jgi:hypothetical protein